MNRLGKRLAIVLSLVLAITVFCPAGASAATKPNMPTNVQAHPSSGSVMLIWDRSKQNILGYRIWMSDNGGDSYRIIKTLDLKRYPKLKKVQKVAYKVTGLKKYKQYRFRVLAYVNDEKGRSLSSSFKTVTSSPVREMRIKFKIKNTGETVIANRVSGGVFITESGRRVSGVRTHRERADYTTSFNYSPRSAEMFINDRKFSSPTNYLVWVSTYTQHVYLMKKSKGKWTYVDGWECATGRPSSPTPTGYNHVKSITKKVRSRHNVSWWSPFSSWNSLHGRVGDSMSLGRPASGGCVRNPDEKARDIYYKCPVGTTVVVF